MYINCILCIVWELFSQVSKPKGCSITERDNLVNQSKLEANPFRQPKALENMWNYATIYFGFTADWLTKWHKISKPLVEVILQNQSKCDFLATLKRKPMIFKTTFWIWSQIPWRKNTSLQNLTFRFIQFKCKLSSTHPISGTVPNEVSWFTTPKTHIALRKRHAWCIRSTPSRISVKIRVVLAFNI